MAMEDFRVDVVIGKGPGRHRDPAGDPAVHAGRRHHPGRAAARAAARPVRLHRPPGVLRAARARPDRAPLGRPARRRAHRPTAPPRSPPAPAARPRIANRLLRRVRDYAQVRADGVVTLRGRPRRARPLRGRRARPRPARPGRARRAVPPLRRGTGRHLHARGRRRRGARDRRGGRRAVPGPQRLPGPYAARPGRDRRRPGQHLGLAAPPRRRGSARNRPRTRRSSGTDRDPGHTRGYACPSVGPCAARHPLLHAREVFFVPALVQLVPFVGIALLFWFLLHPAGLEAPEGTCPHAVLVEGW